MAASGISSADSVRWAGYLSGSLEADERHAGKLAGVVKRVRTRPKGVRISMRKTSKSHTPHGKAFKRDCHLVDVSELDGVLRCVIRS